MSQRQKLQPHPGHPISVEPTKGRVVVKAGGKKIAESRNALSLREASYPVVHYIPLADVDSDFIVGSDHETHCPYKGVASYHSIVVDGTNGENAIWTYRDPYEAVAEIKDHVAFYPDRVEVIVIEEE
ncbi:MAG TPA: DUF427 domain-containing protein [Candidatus Tumulicola sp.]